MTPVRRYEHRRPALADLWHDNCIALPLSLNEAADTREEV